MIGFVIAAIFVIGFEFLYFVALNAAFDSEGIFSGICLLGILSGFAAGAILALSLWLTFEFSGNVPYREASFIICLALPWVVRLCIYVNDKRRRSNTNSKKRQLEEAARAEYERDRKYGSLMAEIKRSEKYRKFSSFIESNYKYIRSVKPDVSGAIDVSYSREDPVYIRDERTQSWILNKSNLTTARFFSLEQGERYYSADERAAIRLLVYNVLKEKWPELVERIDYLVKHIDNLQDSARFEPIGLAPPPPTEKITSKRPY